MLIFRRLSALLFAALLISLVTPLVHAREMVSVARGEVNMRSGPGTRYDAPWGLSRGYPLAVVGRRGAWIKVRDFENDEGWVLRSLTDRTPHHVIRVGTANLRSTPSTRGRIIGKAGYGVVLRTLERRGNWIKVRDQRGTTGWVANHLVWGW